MTTRLVQITLGLLCATVVAQEANLQQPRRGAAQQPAQTLRCTEVPAHAFDSILGRPTLNSATLSILAYEDTEGYVAYGTAADHLDSKTQLETFSQTVPVEVTLSGLKADTRYYYQFCSTRMNRSISSFHTGRPPGSEFTFTVTADSHLDEHTDPAVYQQTLAHARADQPDFHIDLGDTFMTEKHADRAAAAKQYLAQRYYFHPLCECAALFLALGNHDGESFRGRRDETNGLPVWSNLERKKYFPNPIPSSFYSGNGVTHPGVGLLQDYFSWEWGDALFVVLDPYWFTPKTRGPANNWNTTLGEQQYHWLKVVLEGSQARYKFVFIHNLAGGADSQGRGGVEAAPFYEWGGRNADGSAGFASHRPGWEFPIHTLLVRNKVNIVFHGHDHFYARQDLDGVAYILVPQPGFPSKGRNQFDPYGYKEGILLGGSGHVRVKVSPGHALLEYVRSETETRIADSLRIQAR